MDTGSFSSLSPLFQKTAAKLKVTRQLDEAHACFVMNQFLTEIDQAKGKIPPATAKEVKNGLMTIAVHTSAQSQNISLHKLELLEKMRVKGFAVTSLKLQLT